MTNPQFGFKSTHTHTHTHHLSAGEIDGARHVVRLPPPRRQCPSPPAQRASDGSLLHRHACTSRARGAPPGLSASHGSPPSAPSQRQRLSAQVASASGTGMYAAQRPVTGPVWGRRLHFLSLSPEPPPPPPLSLRVYAALSLSSLCVRARGGNAGGGHRGAEE
jgi:hypothetical protein